MVFGIDKYLSEEASCRLRSFRVFALLPRHQSLDRRRGRPFSSVDRVPTLVRF